MPCLIGVKVYFITDATHSYNLLWLTLLVKIKLRFYLFLLSLSDHEATVTQALPSSAESDEKASCGICPLKRKSRDRFNLFQTFI